ncbi:MAG: PEP-CTERM sorting domain-containing protein [Armatimonadetes bacterium]|nr:PEP-CTERM sorting domain-containing protein [Armatimonadota bacterium]
MNRFVLSGSVVSTLVFAALTVPVVAAPITVPNASFESSTVGAGSTDFGNTPNFAYTGVSPAITRGDTVRPATALGGQDGNYIGAIALDNNDGSSTTPNNSTGQLTSDSLGVFAANTVYTLTVAQARTTGYGGGVINVGFGFSANGVLTATSLRDYNDLSDTAFADFSTIVSTVDSPGLVGQDLRVALLANSTYDFGRSSYFDNIRLDASPAVAVVPEPATLGLLALGMMAVVVVRRRK